MDLESDAIQICQDLIQIPSENFGDRGYEADVARYVANSLAEVGIASEIIDSAPGRSNVVAKIEADSDRPGLVLHGHLDVVPADAKAWTYPPFSAQIADGAIWGRGAVDMKNMDAMMLACVRSWARNGIKPPRDISLVFFADEEAGGEFGSHWLVEHRPDVFKGCNEAISEVGGFSVTLENQTRIYLIETAQKGIHWMRLTADLRAGHGSMIHEDNAVTEIAKAVANIGGHQWPMRRTKSVDELLEKCAEILNQNLDLNNEDDVTEFVKRLGPVSRLIGATLRNTANPTRLDAGYKENVIPQTASAVIDGRFLPGFEDEFDQTIRNLIGNIVSIETINRDIALENSFEGALIQNMIQSIASEDPDGIAVPYTLSGGTDNKALSKLGIRGYGFSPLKLPADLDFTSLFHGVDERIPIDSLKFGARVLDRFLRNA